MPKSSSNKNDSILLKQILGEFAGGSGGSSRSGSGTGSNQGTPPELLALYRLTAPQSVAIPALSHGVIILNTDDAQSPSTLVTSQTPFTYTATTSEYILLEYRIVAQQSANLERYVSAATTTRNGFTSNAVYSFDRRFGSATTWIFTCNARILVEQGDNLQITLRAYNKNITSVNLTLDEALIILKRA